MGDAFCHQCYHDRYPDLQAAFKGNVNSLQKHYQSHGIKENRNAKCDGSHGVSTSQIIVKDFCFLCYQERYEDLNNLFRNNYNQLYDHYINNGIKEGRDASCSCMTKIDDFLFGSTNMDFSSSDNDVLISIILVVYNRVELTYRCLKSLQNQKFRNFEIIVVNNSSKDRTGELLSKLIGITHIKNNENLHFLRAANQGVQCAKGKFILFLNNDTVVLPNCFESLLRTFEKYENVGAVGGRILNMNGKLQEAGCYVKPDGSTGGYGRDAKVDNYTFMFERPVDFCSGCLLLIPKNIFNQMGGFDEYFIPAYYEDTDLCMRLWKHGYSVYYQPQAIIYHNEGASSQPQEIQTLMRDNYRKFSSRYRDDIMHRTSNVLELRIRDIDRLKRILWIDYYYPVKKLGIGYGRTVQLLNILARNNFSITYYAIGEKDYTWGRIYSDLDQSIEVCCSATSLQSFLDERRGYYGRIAIARWCVMNQILHDVPNIKSYGKIIYDSETLASERGDIERQLFGKSPEPVLSQDIDFAKVADIVIAVSEQNKLTFLSNGIENVKIISHIIDLQLTPNKFEDRSDFLFVGNLVQHPPNIDSVHWFVRECWPQILQHLGSVKLHIVGNAIKSIQNLENNNIIVHGSLDQQLLENLYNTTRISIAPTRYASGIPVKVYSSASYGLPVIASKLLVDQMAWNDNEDILAAATSTEFIEKSISLYTNETLWNEIRTSAFDRLRRENSHEVLAPKLVDIFNY